MNDITLPVAPLIQGTQGPSPQFLSYQPLPISFVTGICTILALYVPNRASLLARDPSNQHPKTPTLSQPSPNSLLTTASSWGAWSPTTSITGHLEVQCQGGGGEPLALPHPPRPRKQLENVGLQRGNSLLNPTNPTKRI